MTAVAHSVHLSVSRYCSVDSLQCPIFLAVDGAAETIRSVRCSLFADDLLKRIDPVLPSLPRLAVFTSAKPNSSLQQQQQQPRTTTDDDDVDMVALNDYQSHAVVRRTAAHHVKAVVDNEQTDIAVNLRLQGELDLVSTWG